MDVFSRPGVQKDACVEICRHMVKTNYAPYELISKEGSEVYAYNAILEGSVLAWRTQQDRSELTDMDREYPDEMQGDARKRKSSLVAARRGSIPGPLGGVEPINPVYRPSIWGNVETAMEVHGHH